MNKETFYKKKGKVLQFCDAYENKDLGIESIMRALGEQPHSINGQSLISRAEDVHLEIVHDPNLNEVGKLLGVFLARHRKG
jgi:hypothetical protein